MDEIEIPEAIRENIEVSEKSRSSLLLPLIAIAILCLGIGGLLSIFLLSPKSQPNRDTVNSDTAPITTTADPANSPAQQPIKQPTGKQTPEQTTANNQSVPTKSDKAIPSKTDLLGHLPYEVAPKSDLTAITADSQLQMRAAAAKKFRQMQADAMADGVNLVPISAFRTTQAQEQLFFGVKEQRVQDAAKRAEVSAPPGYSEHHTGYAIDLGDGDAPATNLEIQFADTAAFIWLKQNAPKYSFELSFPPNNEQGVSYEPWHWRFVGDRHSLETFYKVRN